MDKRDRNSSRGRVIVNEQGEMFLPMNMSVNTDNEHFINVPKLALMGVLVIISVWFFNSVQILRIVPRIVFSLIYVYGVVFVVRLTILEEKYYLKVMRKNKAYLNPKPDIFWNITSIANTSHGDVAVFADMKIGCFVKIDRDTIIGKADDGEDIHFNAWSDFYKELNKKDLSRVQMNLMEPSGKDDRIQDLANLASKCENKALRELAELEVGHIREISRVTLSESDYFLIYTTDISKLNTLAQDTMECVSFLLEGAYSNAEIMGESDIYSIPKVIDNVEYFDGIGAQLSVYQKANLKVKPTMEIQEVALFSGERIKVGENEKKVIHNLTSSVKSGELNYGDWTVSDALKGNISKLNKGVIEKGEAFVRPKMLERVSNNRGNKSGEPEFDINLLDDEEDLL